MLSGRRAPGARLPPQRALAAELGVNMASVREGVKRLEQLRLVETRHGDGMRVCGWRANGGLDVLVHAVADGGPLEAPLLREVLEARRLLLAEAAALAATRRSAEQATLLARLARDVAAAPEPPLPPVADTDAAAAFGARLVAGPRRNRVALRGGLPSAASSTPTSACHGIPWPGSRTRDRPAGSMVWRWRPRA